jgi:hypothetical protein
MTRIVDPEGRVTLPPQFHSGDVVELKVNGEDEVLLRRRKTADAGSEKPRLVHLEDGFTVFVGGPKITTEDVKRMLEDFP